MINTKKAITISRISEKPKEKGNSLPAQTERLKNYCERKGYKIIEQFSYDESAYKKNRRGFDEILDFVLNQKEIVAVCFDKVDRLSRNVFDKRVSELYEKALRDEVELHFPSDGQIINSKISATEKFQFSISLGLAKYYSDAISDNVKRAQEQMLRSGIWAGKAPYGYRNITKPNDTKWITVEAFEAQVVEKMYEWYSTSAYSMNLIRNEIKKVFNLDFSKSRIDHILKNPFYCGTMIYNKQKYPHNYDRVITQGLFDKVQGVKAGHHKMSFKYAGLPFLYRGLIKCADCGCMITPEKKTKKSGQIYHYYHCTQYNGKHGAQWLREEDLTKQFAEAFNGLQMPDEVLEDITEALKNTHKNKSDFHETMLKQHQTNYKKYQNRIEEMYEDKLDGSITKSFYEEKRNEYRAKQDEINKKMMKLKFADEEYYLTSEYMLKLASRASELFESSEPMEKRLLLKMTLQNLALDGKKARFDWIKPFDTIALYASRSSWLRR
ncbi:recombinase family protein [Patescibacteria group bacterium]